MDSIKVYFSNNEELILSLSDVIIPIEKYVIDNQTNLSMAENRNLYYHTHNGLIPSFLEAICTCEFFYVNSSYSSAYNPHAIVKVEWND